MGRGDLTGTGSAVRVGLIALTIGMCASSCAPCGPSATIDARRIVAEAHAHTLETGRPVEAEFGTPTSYAARFAPDLRCRSRLTAAFFAALAARSALLLVDEPEWTGAALVSIFGWLAWREHRSSRRGHGADDALTRSSLAPGTSDRRVSGQSA